MDGLAEMLEYGFMQRAFLGGAAVASMAGILGTFVVQRGLSFLGDGLAHASFGGIALGALIASTTAATGLLAEPVLIALPFTLAVALLIAWVRDATTLSSDTVIGVFFAVSVALGVVFLSRIPPDQNVIDVWHLLFGSILAVGRVELWIILATAAGVVGVMAWLWGRLAYATFDGELARSDGVPVRRLDYLLFVLSAVAVVVSAQVVGVILMAAYLVIPAASARLVARSLMSMTVGAVAIGLGTTWAGLAASFRFDVPSGAAIVLLQAAAFAVAMMLRRR